MNFYAMTFYTGKLCQDQCHDNDHTERCQDQCQGIQKSNVLADDPTKTTKSDME